MTNYKPTDFQECLFIITQFHRKQVSSQWSQTGAAGIALCHSNLALVVGTNGNWPAEPSHGLKLAIATCECAASVWDRISSRHPGIVSFLESSLSVIEKVFGVLWVEDERKHRSRKTGVFLSSEDGAEIDKATPTERTQREGGGLAAGTLGGLSVQAGIQSSLSSPWRHQWSWPEPLAQFMYSYKHHVQLRKTTLGLY